MAVNGIGFRGIERVTDIHQTTILNWVKQVGTLLPDAHTPDDIPDVGELDELQTFVVSKKQSLDLDSRQPFQTRYLRLGHR